MIVVPAGRGIKPWLPPFDAVASLTVLKVDFGIECGPGPVARCKADPCEVNKCRAHPDANCIASFCTGKYRGVPVGPCGAIFVDEEGDVLKCGKETSESEN